jgi:hypothetical protein
MGSSHALRHDFGVSSSQSFAPVSLLLGSTSFDHETENHGSFSLDSSNRQPAQLETRERMRNERETGAAPTHISCIAAVIEMSFYSVHEFNQPITALLTDAPAALSFPTGQSPITGRGAARSQPRVATVESTPRNR